MQFRYSLLAVLALAAPAAAQWSDNFDGYPNATLLDNVGGWFGWDNTSAAAGVVSNLQSLSAPHSIEIAGGADAVQPGLGATCGQWTLTAWQYIPTGGFTADTYFIVNNIYNHGGPYQWTIELQFDVTSGNVLDDFRPETNTVPIVLDQWVEIRNVIDLDANTVTSFYNNVEVSTGVYNVRGGPVAIENLDLFTTGGQCFYDDISLSEARSQVLNEVGLYPGATTFTSRSGVAGGEHGDVTTSLMNFRGIGQVTDCNTGTTINSANGFQAVIQDQDASTQENYTFVILPDDGSGAPDPDPNNELLRTAPALLPPGAAGPAAWIITTSLATPYDGLPSGGFHFGTGVPDNALWTADGVSVHAASYTVGTAGDDPRTTGAAPGLNVTNTISRAGGAGTLGIVNAQPSGRSHRQLLLTPGASLNWGQDTTLNPAPRSTVNPAFGVGGMYPRMVAGTEDGVVIRVVDASMPDGSLAAFLASTTFSASGLALPILEGDMHLLPLGGAWIDMGGAAYASGAASMTVAMPGTLGGITAVVAGQCVTINMATGALKASSAGTLSVAPE